MPQQAPLTFFEHPILNSPYAYPGRHWELDVDGQPTNQLIESHDVPDDAGVHRANPPGLEPPSWAQQVAIAEPERQQAEALVRR